MKIRFASVPVFLLVFCLIVIATFVVAALGISAQATPNFQCLAPTGYGSRATPIQIILDLQCQPAFGDTVEIPPGGSITIIVNLNNYYSATGRTSASFNIHLAMDRALLTVRQSDVLQGTDVSDTLAAMRDIPISTTGSQYTFIVQNRGLRSAVFDLSVRPRAG